MLVPSLALSVITSAFATAVVVLINLGGVLGAILVVLITVIAAGAYRGYAHTRHRHQDLELVHGFVVDGTGAGSVNALAEQLLGRILSLMSAGGVELHLYDPDHPRVTRMSIDEHGQLQVKQRDLDPVDWVSVQVRTEHEPVLLGRADPDRAKRSWLSAQGLRDAVIVPLPAADGATGLIMVCDRLGETTTFTADDVALLQTLTGHLSVAFRSTRLVDKLSHDSLTGLHNRAYLASHIDATVTVPNDIAVLLPARDSPDLGRGLPCGRDLSGPPRLRISR